MSNLKLTNSVGNSVKEQKQDNENYSAKKYVSVIAQKLRGGMQLIFV